MYKLYVPLFNTNDKRLSFKFHVENQLLRVQPRDSYQLSIKKNRIC